jgi:hypothetical protein
MVGIRGSCSGSRPPAGTSDRRALARDRPDGPRAAARRHSAAVPHRLTSFRLWASSQLNRPEGHQRRRRRFWAAAAEGHLGELVQVGRRPVQAAGRRGCRSVVLPTPASRPGARASHANGQRRLADIQPGDPRPCHEQQVPQPEVSSRVDRPPTAAAVTDPAADPVEHVRPTARRNRGITHAWTTSPLEDLPRCTLEPTLVRTPALEVHQDQKPSQTRE